MRVLACRRDEKVFEAKLDSLAELVADESVHLWLQLDDRSASHKHVLTELFGVHPLLVEDILSVAPSPKAEVFPGYIYLILHGLRDTTKDEVHTFDVDVLVGARFLITHLDAKLTMFDSVAAELLEDPSLLQRGPMFVAHRLIDMLVDDFLPLMDRLDRNVAQLEDEVMRNSGPKILERVFSLKHSLQRLHRVGIHQRSVLGMLADGSLEVPLGSVESGEVRPFFRDVHDHFVKVMDLTENYRELVDSSSDAYLSIQSHKLNEVMKVLTVISTIMLPLTFITGLYGMNFDHMPGIHWRYGYEMAWGVMLLTALALFVFSKRKQWI